MKKVKEQLGKEVSRNLLFLHAITRCDTSLFYGVGKATALKKFENVLNFKEQANVFSYHNSAVSDVVTTGEKALVSLFGGKPGVGLNNLRYQRYFGKTCKQDFSYWPTESAPNSSCCSISQPARLPTGKAVAWRRCWHVDRWKIGGGKSLMIKYFLLQWTCRLPKNRFFS